MIQGLKGLKEARPTLESQATGRGGARVGAGRKPALEGIGVPVSGRVPQGLVTQLDEIQAARGWNRSQAVTEAVRELIKADAKKKKREAR